MMILPGERACGEDAQFSLGRAGWSLEYFGDEVTLLRSNPVGADPSADAATLILSCDGRERRLRLTFSARSGSFGLASGAGSLLIRAIDRAGSVVSSLYAPFVANGRTLLVSSNAGGRDPSDPVLGLAEMLQARPLGLDMLIHSEADPFVLSRLMPARLSLSFGPDEGRAFREFGEVCARTGADSRKR